MIHKPGKATLVLRLNMRIYLRDFPLAVGRKLDRPRVALAELDYAVLLS
jgi:hypothetical protein